MSEFRTISDTMLVAEQIGPADVARAKDAGVTLIINNRPDGEAPGQPLGSTIEAAANDLGVDYLAIPVSAAGFSLPQVEAMGEALSSAQGKVLAFCRSGTRSTFLWSLAQARQGQDFASIEAKASAAGYNITPIRPTIEMLSSGEKG